MVPEWNLDHIDQLFGREKEMELLKRILDDEDRAISSATTVLILHGPEGSGKSSLIRSQPWQERGWFFASGKYEHAGGGEPFSALIEALDGLADVLVNSQLTPDQMGAFQNLLKQDFEFLQSVFPKAYRMLSSTCCDQADKKKKFLHQSSESMTVMDQDLGTIDCLNGSFVRTIQAICAIKPLVLFLDEVHFADKASLEVLKSLTSSNGVGVTNLVLALSYRDEVVVDNPQHPILEALQHMKDAAATTKQQQARTRIFDIAVGGLDVDSVNRMVASVMQRRNAEETLPLAQVIHKKTAGNPFFVLQFLRMLRQEEFVQYSLSTFQWEWGDVDKLDGMAHVSDNVADILANTMTSVVRPSTTLVLKVAACFGKVVPLNILVDWFGSSFSVSNCGAGATINAEDLQNALDDAVAHGILVCSKDGEQKSSYMWAHDRLQTVAYSLICESERPQLHLKLGRHLCRTSQKNPDEEWMVFMAADQMNRYATLRPANDDDADSLGTEAAALCLEAAKLSLSKSALYPAYDMLAAGIKHLPDDDKWGTEHYELSLRLYSTMAELAVQLGRVDEAMKAVDEVEASATCFEDKFRVQIVALKCATADNDRYYQFGIEKTIEILKDYDVRFPTKLLPGQLMVESQKMKRRLPGGRLEGVLSLPEMTDVRSKRIMKLLVGHLAPFIFMYQKKGNSALGWYAAIKALNLSIDKGVTAEAALAIVIVGAACVLRGCYKEAEEYADMGMKLLKRFPQRVGSVHSVAMISAAGGIYSETKPLGEVLDLWLEAHHIALRTGFTEKAGMAIFGYTFTYINVGLPLGPLKSDLMEYENEARQFNLSPCFLAVFKMVHQFILNLEDSSVRDPTVLKGEAFDEDEVLKSFGSLAFDMTKRDINTFQLFLAVTFGKWEMVEMLITALEPYLENDQFLARSGMRQSLVALAALKISHRNNQKRRLRSVAKKILKEFKLHLQKGNVNALPVYTMLLAEEAPSKERYDSAIRSCARLGLVHFEAFMCEQAGCFFLTEKNDDSWAEFYIAQAYALYGDWGATAKASQLKEQYPRMLRSASLQGKASTALRGRTRYSSSHTDILKDFDWDRLSGSTRSGDSARSSATRSASSSDDEDSLTPPTTPSSNTRKGVFGLGGIQGLFVGL